MAKFLVFTLFTTFLSCLAPTVALAEAEEHLALEISKGYGQALRLIQEGKTEAALEVMRAFKPQTPKYKALHHSLQGQALMEADRPADAVHEFRKAVSFGGWMGRGALAKALAESGDYKSAYDELSKYNSAFAKLWNVTAMEKQICEFESEEPSNRERQEMIGKLKESVAAQKEELDSVK